MATAGPIVTDPFLDINEDGVYDATDAQTMVPFYLQRCGNCVLGVAGLAAGCQWIADL